MLTIEKAAGGESAGVLKGFEGQRGFENLNILVYRSLSGSNIRSTSPGRALHLSSSFGTFR